MTRSASAVGQNTSFHQALLLKVFAKYRMMELNRLFVESFFTDSARIPKIIRTQVFSSAFLDVSREKLIAEPRGGAQAEKRRPRAEADNSAGAGGAILGASFSHEFPRLELESEVLLHGLRTGSV